MKRSFLMTNQEWGALLPILLIIAPLIFAVMDFLGTASTRRPVVA